MTENHWNQILQKLPGQHILQTWEWAQFKDQHNWEMYPLLWVDTPTRGIVLQNFTPSPAMPENIVAAAMVLIRNIPIRGFSARMSISYVPKGPVLNWENRTLYQQVLTDLIRFTKRKGSIFIKIDPDVIIGTGIPDADDSQENLAGKTVAQELQDSGWSFSQDQIQFQNTVTIPLNEPEEALLARMKQKTRYNIRLAQRRGVQVRPGTPADFDLLYHMYAETSIRDGFVIRNQAYYQDLWGRFYQVGMLEPLIGEVEGDPVAAVIIFRFAKQAYYMHGMSRDLHRNLMPTYLLQWEAMCRAKQAGCQAYDLWGAPSIFDENDPMWGVFRFKQGLGGNVFRHLGAWDYPIRPTFYRFYTQFLPRVLDFMRRRGKKQTREIFNG